MIDVDTQIADLRNLVRTLDATGPEGFEGLLSAVLTVVTKTLFRLAKSGSQHGKDGQSAHDGGAITFEAKLYDKEVFKNEVLSKIAEIFAYDDGAADLWILGSTGGVATQDADIVEAVGKKAGIATLIADWSKVGLPTLAALLAMAPAEAAKFFATNVKADEVSVREMLEAVRVHPQFADRAGELRDMLKQPSIGPAYALQNNRLWLSEAFKNSKRARIVFGQALAPADSARVAMDRPALRQQLSSAAFGKPGGSPIALLGSEGNGKSWLFAQAWVHEATPPLTVILIPEDVPDSSPAEAMEELLISKLIVQTDDTPTDTSRQRWRRHFERWRHANRPDRPHVVVYLDGINQRPTVRWARLIHTLTDLLSGLGCKLIFSCRTPFFRERIRRGLASHIEVIDVPEWTVNELEVLLSARGTSTSKLRPEVVNSLRNPRIFSIAAELFHNEEIESFSELSVSRLLFEHIRTSAAATVDTMEPYRFVRIVRDHADEIIDRLKSKKTADLKVFDAESTEEQFAAVSSGQFFRPLEDEPTRYRLTDDGLPLALGLSLVSAAKRAYRNQLNVESELSAILDPIAALDQTAEILLSAVLAAVLDDRTPIELAAGLIGTYIGLQNLDTQRYSEFRALARRSPPAFLLALEKIALAGRTASNNSWLIGALTENRSDAVTFEAIQSSVHRWLGMYSDSPERLMMIPKRDATESERLIEYEKRKKELDDKRNAFSGVERELWKTLLRQEDGEFTNLSRIAFQLLAGVALKPFAEPLRNWSLVNAYAGAGFSADQEFRALIQFNRVDWIDAREALINSLQMLRGTEISATGRRALIKILYATGSSDDAQDAARLAEDLAKDREHTKGWRWVEQLCATDPCDPDSERPDNIDSTAAKFVNMNVTTLSRPAGRAQVDRLFEDALAGLARFEPDAAIRAIRAFAADVLTRGNEDFLNAVFVLRDHSSALDEATAKQFVNKAASLAKDALTLGDEHHDLWSAAQIALAIAFPHLTGEEQLEVLVSHPKSDNLLLDLTELFQECSSVDYDAHLERAVQTDDQTMQFRVLVFGQFTDTEISDKSRSFVAQMISSSSRFVRLAALGLICRLNDPALLQKLVASEWSASKLQDLNENFEAWYGCEALALAAEHQLVPVEDCLRRMSVSGYSSLVGKCGRDAALAVAERLDSAIAQAAAYSIDVMLPDIELRLGWRSCPGLLHIKDKPARENDPRETIQNLSETVETRRLRDRQNSEAVEKFERDLNQAGAELICEAVSSDLMEEIAKFAPSAVRAWCGRFLALDSNALARVHNIALLVAQVLSKEDSESAVALFEKLDSSTPHIHVTFGAAGIPLSAESVWNADDNAEIQKLRFARLDGARNDHEIAIEVLAGLRAGKAEALRDYVLDRRARREPFHVCRAVMVAGFSEGDRWATDTVEALKDCQGLLGCAYDTASYAVARYRWSTHWAKMMSESMGEIELWRYGTLLGVIVDGRCVDHDEIGRMQQNPIYGRCRPTFENAFRKRINRWRDKRIKNLFGVKAPDPLFLR